MSDVSDTRIQHEPLLGDLLREARVNRGLELTDLAGLTHVRREYLAALEEGRYGDLPEDVYTKNFLRLYAQAVGFDVVRAQEIYRSERREAAGLPPADGQAEQDAQRYPEAAKLGGDRRWWDGQKLGTRWATLLSTVVMVVAVVALALWGFNSAFFTASRTPQLDNDQDGASGSPTPNSAVSESAEPATESTTTAIPRTVRLSVSSTPSGAEVSVDEFPLPGTTPIESAPVTARPSRTIRVTLDGYEPFEAEFDLTFDRNLSFALTPQSAGTEPEPEEEEAPGVEGGAEAEPAGPAGPQAVLTIVDDTWLEVYQGTARNQGQRLAFTTARSGQTLQFPLPVFVYAGNAGGVELNVDGQNRGALGSTGEVRGLAVTQ